MALIIGMAEAVASLPALALPVTVLLSARQ
jgi:hypothetical protein